MKGLRIQPESRHTVSVGITCHCGSGVMKNEKSGNIGFNHSFMTFPPSSQMILACDCGKRFQIRVQATHFHIDEL